MSKKEKKKFKETKVGAFLTEKAPKLVSQLGEFLPDQGGLGIVKNLITSDKSIKPADKDMALKLLDQDIAELHVPKSKKRSKKVRQNLKKFSAKHGVSIHYF